VPARARARAWLAAAVVLGAVGHAAADDEPGLSLSDLAPYRAALEGRGASAGPAVSVTFRDLWDHPDRYKGRRVRVEGRVARRFRQGAYGTFPPLVEAWAVSPAGDPFCLTYPAPADAGGNAGGGPDAAPGASVRFEGVFLRRLRYRGADADRLAPLIVGDRPPAVVAPAPARPASGRPDTGAVWFEWALGLAAAAFVALALARQHLRGPSRRPTSRDADPPPDFLDGA